MLELLKTLQSDVDAQGAVIEQLKAHIADLRADLAQKDAQIAAAASAPVTLSAEEQAVFDDIKAKTAANTQAITEAASA